MAGTVFPLARLEVQVFCGRTGQLQQTSKRYRNLMIHKKQGGVKLIADKVVFKIRFDQSDQVIKVYSSYTHMGKLTFISQRRGQDQRTQYNLSEALPKDLYDLSAFAVRMGAVAAAAAPQQKLQQQQKPLYISALCEASDSNTSQPTQGSGLQDITHPLHSTNESNRRTESNGFLPLSTMMKSNEREALRSKKESNKPLTAIQKNVVQMVKLGKNVFITGCAGTGKSFLLKYIYKMEQRRDHDVFITATTGVAAYNLGGMTVHAFAGLTPRNDEPRSETLARCMKNQSAIQRMRSARIVIIDEISMLDGDFFDLFEFLARNIRRSPKPFGGLQLVLCGDFFQLPPVAKNHEAKFCFESNSWMHIDSICELTDVFRQKDQEFIGILDQIRRGEHTQAMIDTLNTRCLPIHELLSIDTKSIMEICTHNKDASRINNQQLELLPGDLVTHRAEESGKMGMLSGCPAPSILQLKIGAQVVLIKSLSVGTGLVNGARGIITKFTKEGHLPVVNFRHVGSVVINREEWTASLGPNILARRKQFPLTLAWATSIHRSQGMAFDQLKLKLVNVFETGQTYVALSRLRTLQGLILMDPLQSKHIQAHEKVKRFYSLIKSEANNMHTSMTNQSSTMKK